MGKQDLELYREAWRILADEYRSAAGLGYGPGPPTADPDTDAALEVRAAVLLIEGFAGGLSPSAGKVKTFEAKLYRQLRDHEKQHNYTHTGVWSSDILATDTPVMSAPLITGAIYWRSHVVDLVDKRPGLFHRSAPEFVDMNTRPDVYRGERMVVFADACRLTAEALEYKGIRGEKNKTSKPDNRKSNGETKRALTTIQSEYLNAALACDFDNGATAQYLYDQGISKDKSTGAVALKSRRSVGITVERAVANLGAKDPRAAIETCKNMSAAARREGRVITLDELLGVINPKLAGFSGYTKEDWNRSKRTRPDGD